MTTKDIKSPEDLKIYIDGIIHDFELGLTHREDTIDLIEDLILKIGKASKEGKKLFEM